MGQSSEGTNVLLGEPSPDSKTRLRRTDSPGTFHKSLVGYPQERGIAAEAGAYQALTVDDRNCQITSNVVILSGWVSSAA